MVNQSTLERYLEALLKFDFDVAENYLKNIAQLYSYKHPWEIKAQKIEFQNLNDVKKEHNMLLDKKR